MSGVEEYVGAYGCYKEGYWGAGWCWGCLGGLGGLLVRGEGGSVERDRGVPVVVEEGVFVFLHDGGGEAGGQEGEVGCQGEEGEGVGLGEGEEEDLLGVLISASLTFAIATNLYTQYGDVVW